MQPHGMMTASTVISGATGDTPATGTLFAGLGFFVLQRVPMRSHYVHTIEANGGRMVKLEQMADYVIADHVRADAPAGSYSYTFIEEAIRCGQLPDLAKHATSRNIGEARPVGPQLPRKTTRQPFTAQEDGILREWVQEKQSQGLAVKGHSIYQELEARYPQHTYHSWRERYLKKLIHTSAPASHPTRDDGEAPLEEQDFSHFSHADFQRLIENAPEIEGIDENRLVDAWTQWTQANAGHTAEQWRSYYEIKVRPVYDLIRKAATGTKDTVAPEPANRSALSAGRSSRNSSLERATRLMKRKRSAFSEPTEAPATKTPKQSPASPITVTDPHTPDRGNLQRHLVTSTKVTIPSPGCQRPQQPQQDRTVGDMAEYQERGGSLPRFQQNVETANRIASEADQAMKSPMTTKAQASRQDSQSGYAKSRVAEDVIRLNETSTPEPKPNGRLPGSPLMQLTGSGSNYQRGDFGSGMVQEWTASPTGAPWTSSEDDVVLKGMRMNWTSLETSRELCDRSACAVRARKKLLKEQYGGKRLLVNSDEDSILEAGDSQADQNDGEMHQSVANGRLNSSVPRSMMQVSSIDMQETLSHPLTIEALASQQAGHEEERSLRGADLYEDDPNNDQTPYLGYLQSAVAQNQGPLLSKRPPWQRNGDSNGEAASGHDHATDPVIQDGTGMSIHDCVFDAFINNEPDDPLADDVSEQGEDKLGLALAEPDGGWPIEQPMRDSEAGSESTSIADAVETQDILDAETQELDLEVPLPLEWEDESEQASERRGRQVTGWEGNSSSKGSSSNVRQSPEHTEELAEWVARMQGRGFEDAAIVRAIKRASLRPDLAMLILHEERAGRGFPSDVSGVWSEEEDEALEGSDAHKLRLLEYKHGAEECDARRGLLEKFRGEQ